jgi:hypothetical protein
VIDYAIHKLPRQSIKVPKQWIGTRVPEQATCHACRPGTTHLPLWLDARRIEEQSKPEYIMICGEV